MCEREERIARDRASCELLMLRLFCSMNGDCSNCPIRQCVDVSAVADLNSVYRRVDTVIA